MDIDKARGLITERLKDMWDEKTKFGKNANTIYRRAMIDTLELTGIITDFDAFILHMEFTN